MTFAGFSHGSIIGPESLNNFDQFKPVLSVTPPSGGYDKAVIFNTQDPNVPGNPQVEDQDLIPTGGNRRNDNFGNIAIIQENTTFTITNDRIDDPYRKVDDHANGGTFTFDLNPGADTTIDSFRIDLIDVETPSQIKIVAFGPNGSFTWTGADLLALEPTIEWGDATANRTSDLTALQAGLSEIIRVDIISKTSFAIDNFKVNGTVIPEVSSSFLCATGAMMFCLRRRRKS